MTSHNIKPLVRVRKVYMQYAVPMATRKNLFINIRQSKLRACEAEDQYHCRH